MTSLWKVARLSFSVDRLSGIDMKWVMRSRSLLLHVIISRRCLASATDRSDCPSIAATQLHHFMNGLHNIFDCTRHGDDVECHPLTREPSHF